MRRDNMMNLGLVIDSIISALVQDGKYRSTTPNSRNPKRFINEATRKGHPINEAVLEFEEYWGRAIFTRKLTSDLIYERIEVLDSFDSGYSFEFSISEDPNNMGIQTTVEKLHAGILLPPLNKYYDTVGKKVASTAQVKNDLIDFFSTYKLDTKSHKHFDTLNPRVTSILPEWMNSRLELPYNLRS